MANTKGSSNFRIPSFLPPRSPFPSISPAHVGPKGTHIQREGPNRHQRTSSEILIFEEQPSWLDDLLNEPETPLKKGVHRRSSSDSFQYADMSPASLQREDLDLCHVKQVQYPSYSTGMNNHGRSQFGGREPCLHNTILPAQRSLASIRSTRETDSLMCPTVKRNGEEESAAMLERREDASSDNSQTEADSKRVKQKFAQRSRVRKLQYIAELERNCQTLQAGGCEVAAELEFLDQQNLILNLENTALKQRLESLAQEKFIKHLQQEMLEREIARLRILHHQQQQQQMSQHHHEDQPIAMHSRTRSRDLDDHFANLSLKHRESNPRRDPVTGPLHI